MTHSPYLNHTSVFGQKNRPFHQGHDPQTRAKNSHYMNYQDRFMESDPSSQIVKGEKNTSYIITPLNILSAGLCIAAFGLGVAWFGWPDRLHMIFKDLGVKKTASMETTAKKTTAAEIDEGFYSASLSSHNFLIPGENLRHIHRDDAGIARRIDLLAQLSTQEKPAQKGRILPSTEKEKLYISLSNLNTTMTPKTRLETTYKHHLADEGVATSLGLTLYRFKQDTGYGDQELYTGALPEGSYVSVCFDEMTGLNASRCLSSVSIGDNLVARYNFDRSHIKEWKKINTRVRDIVARMKVGE